MSDDESLMRAPQLALAASEPTVDIGRAAVDDLLLLVTDASGSVVHVSDACERLTGHRRSDLLGQHLEDLLLPAVDSVQHASVLARLSHATGWQQHVSRWRTSTGEYRVVHWSSTPVHTPPSGRAYVFTGVDVTSHAGVDDLLLDSDARLRSILEATVDGIITAGPDGVIESVNPAVERIFGYPAAELVGRKLEMLMPEPYRSHHDGYMSHYLQTGERRIIGIGREVEGLRRDGTIFPIELAVGEVLLPGRRLFTGIIRDITMRRRTEELARQRLDELAHASRLAALGELTSSIAHEINQPLAAIVSFAEASLRMMRAGTGSSEVIKGALEQIAAQGARAGDIVQSLRQFVRKERGERESVDINAVIREVLGLLSHDMRVNRVRLKLVLDEQLPRVMADRIQVEQVTLNLIRNAVDALSEVDQRDRCVTISSARAGRHRVEVAVMDNGVGLPVEGAQRVFETFFTTKPQGMGIGLSICRSLVEAHGGRLTAESNPDRGATFRFSLPLPEGCDADG